MSKPTDAVERAKPKCRCCGKQIRPTGMLGGRLSCKCESAMCAICGKCRDHCTCSWGREAKIQSIVDAGKKRMQSQVKPPLRERVEKHLGLQGEALRTATLNGEAGLLRDALYEAETNMELLTAWTKRATEAESELAAYRERLRAKVQAMSARKDGDDTGYYAQGHLDTKADVLELIDGEQR